MSKPAFWSILGRSPESQAAAVEFGENVDAYNAWQREKEHSKIMAAARKANSPAISDEEMQALKNIDAERRKTVGDKFGEYAAQKGRQLVGAAYSVGTMLNPVDLANMFVPEGAAKHPFSTEGLVDYLSQFAPKRLQGVLDTPEAKEARGATDLALLIGGVPALARGAVSGLSALARDPAVGKMNS